MKTFVIIIVIIYSAMLLSFKNDDTINIYTQALKSYIGNTKVDTLYILKCQDIKIPEKIGKQVLIDIEASEKNWVKQKGTLNAVKIMPIKVDKDFIEITLTDFVLTMENNERVMRNFGSVTFIYKYDISQKKYNLIKKTKQHI